MSDDVFDFDVSPDVFAEGGYRCDTCGQSFTLMPSSSPYISMRSRCQCGTVYELRLAAPEETTP